MNEVPVFIYPKEICKCGHIAEDHGNLSSNPDRPWFTVCYTCGFGICPKFKKQDNLDIVERLAKQKGLI